MSFSFLPMDFQLLQHYLLKKNYSFSIGLLLHLHQNRWTLLGWVCFGALYSVPLICMSVLPQHHRVNYCSYVNSREIEQSDFSHLVLLFQNCSSCYGPFDFPYFKNDLVFAYNWWDVSRWPLFLPVSLIFISSTGLIPTSSLLSTLSDMIVYLENIKGSTKKERKMTLELKMWIQQGHRIQGQHTKSPLYFYVPAMSIWKPKVKVYCYLQWLKIWNNQG